MQEEFLYTHSVDGRRPIGGFPAETLIGILSEYMPVTAYIFCMATPVEGILVVFISSTAIAKRSFAARPSSGTLLNLGIASAVFAGSLAQISHGGIGVSRTGSGDLDLVGVLLIAWTAVPLIVWRRYPFGVFVVTAAASIFLAGLGYPIELMLGPTAALYLSAASRERGVPWTRRATAVVVGLFGVYLGATAVAQGTFPGIELLHTGLALAVAWFAGERTRLLREQIADLRERARYAEQAVERERLLAVAEERARISRDLHDSAGHAINVIAVRAGAARLRFHQDPDRALPALKLIEEVARQTLEEVDQIVGRLREYGAVTEGVEPPPGLASLDTLIAHHASAGLEVTFNTTGSPRPLATAIDQAVYRILQESLTNAARHGTGSARIELGYCEAAIELNITNPMPARRTLRPGGGHGLMGMRERVILLGGNFDTGGSNGLFRVHVRILCGGQQR